MKIAPRDVAAYCARPDPAKAGLLIHGADSVRVGLRRAEAIAALIGPDGPAEMRLTRIEAKALRGDPASLADALAARGFFPGPRAVHLDDATDGLTDTIAAALQTWAPGDAHLVATANALPARSKLRKLFETRPETVSAAIYDDPPGRAEIEAILARAGLTDIPGTAMGELAALAQTLEPGDFAQFAETLGLYKRGDPEPLSPADIAAVAPVSREAGIDTLIDAVAGAEAARIGPLMRRLAAQGQQPVGIIIAALRHFRTLQTIATHPGGPRDGVQALRPPLFGPRRDRMLRQASDWGPARLDRALGLLIETDLSLRSTAPPPAMAAVERVMVRLSFGAAG